jgi:hypothetical protein
MGSSSRRRKSVASAVTVNARAGRGEPPVVLSWGSPDNPLPVRPVRPTQRGRGHVPGAEAPPWLGTGPEDRPFDFGAAVRRLCADIVARSEELSHVDVAQLLFAVTQARSGRRGGLQARVTPLRFRDGHLVRPHRDINYQVQRYFVDGREMLYLMTFCLPRYLEQDFDDKFITLFHELYHIGPAFDGDLRRHAGHCTLHTSSKRQYDAYMADLARAYLSTGPDPSLHAFLRLTFTQLRQRHGDVLGVVVPRPKLIPLAASV